MAIPLPGYFINDSLESDCDVGDYRDGRLTADSAQLAELRSRAEHYASEHGPDAIGDGGVLVRSAKALIKAMDRMGV